MMKVRYFFAAIALALALLSGLAFQGLGLVANAASIHHASSASVSGQLASTSGLKRYGPCPGGGGDDC